MRNHSAQMILYYVVLIAFVCVALFVMNGYIRRRVMGTYKAAGDAFGEGEQATW